MHADVAEPDDGRCFASTVLLRGNVSSTNTFSSAAPMRRATLERLRDSLAQALASDAPVSPLRAVAIAAYFPLYTLPEAQELETRAWPDCINELLTQQIREPREERLLRASIPRLTAIEDDVSLKVRDMYEENPYPRWIKVAPTESPKPLDVYLRDRFPVVAASRSAGESLAGHSHRGLRHRAASRRNGATLRRREDSGDRLVAWRASAYAKRKTREMGLGNIEYGQADILHVGRPRPVIRCHRIRAAFCTISTIRGRVGARCFRY